MRGERASVYVAGERQHGPGRLRDVVVLGVVDDVLADALLAAAAHADDGRHPREVARDVLLQALERVVVDLDVEASSRSQSFTAAARSPALSRPGTSLGS